MLNLSKSTINNFGLRATPARIAVLNILTSSHKPIDVNDILDLLSKEKVYADQATIYRIIESFVTNGIVLRLQFQDRKFYYEAKREEHHHAICTQCAAIYDISKCAVPKIEAEIKKTIGFDVKSHSLEFFGICKKCKFPRTPLQFSRGILAPTSSEGRSK